MKKKIGWGALFIMLTVLTGFKSAGLHGQEPEEKIVDLLREKYGITVTVEEVKDVPPTQAFKEHVYKADAVDTDSGKSFRVSLGKKSGILMDDYPRILYGEQIEQIIKELLSRHPSLSFEYKNIVYILSEEAWQGSDMLQNYLSESDTYFDTGIQIRTSLSQEVDEIYEFAREMEAEGLHFSICIKEDEKTWFLSSTRNTKLKDKDAFKKQLLKEGE